MQNNNNNDNNESVDLQTMMFEQMKRLADPNQDLDKEIKRSQALSSVGTVIINAEKVKIDAKRVAILKEKMEVNPKQLGNGN